MVISALNPPKWPAPTSSWRNLFQTRVRLHRHSIARTVDRRNGSTFHRRVRPEKAWIPLPPAPFLSTAQPPFEVSAAANKCCSTSSFSSHFLSPTEPCSCCHVCLQSPSFAPSPPDLSLLALQGSAQEPTSHCPSPHSTHTLAQLGTPFTFARHCTKGTVKPDVSLFWLP